MSLLLLFKRSKKALEAFLGFKPQRSRKRVRPALDIVAAGIRSKAAVGFPVLTLVINALGIVPAGAVGCPAIRPVAGTGTAYENDEIFTLLMVT